MRLEFCKQCVAFRFGGAIQRDAALRIRRRCRMRAKFRAGKPAQPRQGCPAYLVEHFPQMQSDGLWVAASAATLRRPHTKRL